MLRVTFIDFNFVIMVLLGWIVVGYGLSHMDINNRVLIIRGGSNAKFYWNYGYTYLICMVIGCSTPVITSMILIVAMFKIV